jgi:hypothetical protein
MPRGSTNQPIEFAMKTSVKYHGAVVPLVTPFTAPGVLDEAALRRLVEAQAAGGVEGIFVLGTTGEGAHVPREVRQRLVELTVSAAAKRMLVFAGLGDIRAGDVSEANGFFRAGVDAVVAHPPISEKISAERLQAWFKSLLDHLDGPLLLYNMPTTTGISIPLDAVENLLGHPRLAGIKDSENNPQRHEELLKRFGGKKRFRRVHRRRRADGKRFEAGRGRHRAERRQFDPWRLPRDVRHGAKGGLAGGGRVAGAHDVGGGALPEGPEFERVARRAQGGDASARLVCAAGAAAVAESFGTGNGKNPAPHERPAFVELKSK